MVDLGPAELHRGLHLRERPGGAERGPGGGGPAVCRGPGAGARAVAGGCHGDASKDSDSHLS